MSLSFFSIEVRSNVNLPPLTSSLQSSSVLNDPPFLFCTEFINTSSFEVIVVGLNTDPPIIFLFGQSSNDPLFR